MSISGKILIGSMVPFLLIVGLYHFLSTGVFSKHLGGIFYQRADGSLNQIEEDIRKYFWEKEYDLKLLTFIKPPDQENPAASRIALYSLLQNTESMFRLSAISGNGKEWLRVNKFPGLEEEKLLNLFNSPIYQRPMLDLAPFIGNIRREAGFPLPLVDLSLPFADRQSGKIAGVIWAEISLQGIQALLERYLPAHGKIMLVSVQNGEMLVEADDTRIDFSALEKQVAGEVMRGNPVQGSLERELAGNAVTFYYRKFAVNEVPFFLLYYQPNERIYYLADKLANYNVYAIWAGIIIFILSSFLLIRIIITPLTRVTRMISDLGSQYRSKGVAAGQVKKHRLSGGDEVKQLHDAFEFLRQQLFVYSREIESFNQTMEQEIDGKTKELSYVNEILEEHQHHLENMVTERTNELSGANERLQCEIEERRITQDALSAEKERLTVTLRSIGDGVVTTDRNGIIVLMNKVAEELTGWSMQDGAGNPLSEVFPILNIETGERFSSLVDEVLATGSIIGVAEHMILISRDGQEFNIAISGAPIRDKQSGIVGVVIVFRDETEKVRMEEELLKARKLESVGVLAGGIAHDFNNILAAIMGNISLASLMIRPDEKAHQLLIDAEAASRRAMKLTQQLLTFSKGGEPVKQLTSIEEVIKDSADFVLRGSNVRCEYGIPEGIWPVMVDAGQISQVVQNIIINADHAMSEGGIVKVTCDNVSIDNDSNPHLAPGGYVKIDIKDSGAGIQSEFIDKIFDPYFSTKHEGSGLGLAITHSIVLKHGGHIAVSSTEGEGTTFMMYLPALKEKQAKKIQEAENVELKGSGTILIVDDEQSVRKIAKEMLSMFGFNVLLAQEGGEALGIYQNHMQVGTPVDAVIMDLTIPGGMGGKEAVERLLEIDPDARVIVSSGYSNDPVMANYKEYGFTGVINKPFLTQDLVKKVNGVLAGE